MDRYFIISGVFAVWFGLGIMAAFALALSPTLVDNIKWY